MATKQRTGTPESRDAAFIKAPLDAEYSQTNLDSDDADLDAEQYWTRDAHHDGRPAGSDTEGRAARYDEDADRQYVEEERAQRPVFDAADEMDNPGLKDERDVMRSGRDWKMPAREPGRYAREHSDDVHDGSHVRKRH